MAAGGQRCCEINWFLLLSFCRSWQLPDGYFSMKKLVCKFYSRQKKPITQPIFYNLKVVVSVKESRNAEQEAEIVCTIF